MDIEKINKELATKTPTEIVEWALNNAQSPVVTTNFRPYESAILHLVTQRSPSIKVIWCDTGYNTSSTYKHAEELTDALNLNIQLYIPKQTAAHRDVVLGIPQVEDPKHQLFTEQVKLEPFKRAMAAHKPDVWFTNLRKGQTAFRNSIGVVSRSADGILKVSPFYHFSDKELDQYLKNHDLPNEFNYFDPTKQLDNRECGLHN
ncbi:MAG: phosphoadenosine phosphosulfate reductase family protein [Flavobacteriaceae bacterium]|jgi:phosphoadenosine phosphosulfate reductase|nr:phosphoadenosine phosphosulfate reductase family protein [Flavobacteriaceae bacterium]|tara:strand:- start:1109 stop:1717 length:609 start_codon:yes stop_codon:yes gene_type:complete